MKKVVRRTVKPAYQIGFSGLRPYAFGHALGMMLLLATVFYGLFVWFGDYDATFIVAQYPIAFAYTDWTFLFGLAQSYVLAYVFGWVFAKFYNSV